VSRDELLKLHAALGSVLALPDSVRELLAQWLTPARAEKDAGQVQAVKPNSRDPHPPARQAKARRRTKTAERKLLEAMEANPGLSVIALANAVGSGRSATGERLRQLAVRGVVEKDLTGRWQLKGEEPSPPDPQQPSPN
jgi:hypothetical protein